MADEEEFSWVFESLVGFLKGPVWEAAALTFIEKKSIVFDPVVGNEGEYQTIYGEYKNLVDRMLRSYMEDLGITADDFKKACSETEKNIHSQFRKSLFQQLFAADDYEIFKRMMMQKNLELQLQVLDLLAHQYGLLPESYQPGDDCESSLEEKAIMETVVKRYVEENPDEVPSDAEQQSKQKAVIQATQTRLEEERQRVIKRMEKAVDDSQNDSPKTDDENTLEMTNLTQAVDDSQKTVDENTLEMANLTQAMDDSQNDSQKTDENTLEMTNLTQAVDDSPKTDDENTLEMTNLTQVFPEEVRLRQEYLKQQWQKLVVLKKQEREKLLESYESTDRHRSGRAAQRAVAEVKPNVAVDPNVLVYRKSLSAMLKAEVIDLEPHRFTVSMQCDRPIQKIDFEIILIKNTESMVESEAKLMPIANEQVSDL